jgi:hypothetical protein
MKVETEYSHVCRTSSEIPSGALTRMRPEIVNALGGTVSKMFPGFVRAFPVTADAMQKYWPNPIIVCERPTDRWLFKIVLAREDLNLFFDAVTDNNDIDGEDFDREVEILPTRWIELYRWFFSFCITERAYFSMDWINTPFTWASRQRLENYVKDHLELKSSAVRDVEKRLGIRHEYFKCWLYTDAGDALFIDEFKRDKKVYHVRNNDLTDIVVLPDPEETLDRYLAHVVAGGAPRDFDFRKI